MKETGVVRKLDSLGRIVIPIELRKTLNIQIQDSLEIYTEDDKVILKKFEPGCIFCKQTEQLTEFHGKYICKKCLKELNK